MTTIGKRDTFMPNANLRFFLILLIAFSTFAFADGNNRIIKKIPIPGQGGWDYLIVDEGARRGRERSDQPIDEGRGRERDGVAGVFVYCRRD